MAIFDGYLYAVAGTSLYRVSDGEDVGDIPGGQTLTFASGVSQLVTDNGYIFDGTVTAITDTDKPTFQSVDFVDGYLIYIERDSGRFGGSALNDSSDYDALDFATAEGSPDNLVALKIDHREVLLFGTDSTEIWWNSGTAGFPFERQAGGFVELGCLARLGVVKADNSVFWLASDRTIRRLSGRTPVKVSQYGVEEAFSGYATLADCEAISYTWNGHIFVQFRFPTENATWVYDVTTNEWHETDSTLVAAVHHDGKVWVQDLDGTVGYLSDSVYTRFGENVRREITFPHVYSGQNRQFFSQIDVVMRTGDAPDGVTPYLTLEISDEGGNTFHTLPLREMGVAGNYAKLIRWHRLGSSRDRVFRLSNADPVPFHFVDAQLQ